MTDGLSPNLAGRARPGGSSHPRRPRATIAAVDIFDRAIETSHFERRLKIVEAEPPARSEDVPEMFDAGLASYSTHR